MIKILRLTIKMKKTKIISPRRDEKKKNTTEEEKEKKVPKLKKVKSGTESTLKFKKVKTPKGEKHV